MAYVQVAVGFGGEARVQASVVFAGLQVVIYYLFDKVHSFFSLVSLVSVLSAMMYMFVVFVYMLVCIYLCLRQRLYISDKYKIQSTLCKSCPISCFLVCM